MTERLYCVYIMASRSHCLYTGVTNDLVQRVFIHRQRVPGSFTARYDITRLVYYECASNILSAIAREKQIKGWGRKKKLELIRSKNQTFADLAAGWFEIESRDTVKKIRDSSPLRGSE